MDSYSVILQQKLSGLLRWERRKRREQVGVALVFYAGLAALLLAPFYALLPMVALRWLLPAVIGAVLAPIFFFRGRWQPLDSARALARLDKTLGLQERALTAWELLETKQTAAPALLVFKQAGEKINSLELRAMFRREWGWQAYGAPLLFLLWLALLWSGVEVRLGDDRQTPAPKTVAHQLREFSRELQQRAQSEGLRESLYWGRELEKAARRAIEAKTADDQLRRELAGVAKKIEAVGAARGVGPEPGTAGESEQHLRDLRAELEAARDQLNFPEGATETGNAGQRWLERLAALPQLRKQLDQKGQGSGSFSQNELKSYLEKLEQQVTSELDRRTLLDAQEFLQQLSQAGRKEKGQNEVRVAGQGEERAPQDGEKAKTQSQLPGDEAGRPGSGFQPEFRAGAPSQLKGLLGEGQTNSFVFRGKPSPGKSAVTADEVIATYRRQAEADLDTEQVPEGLKEMIKNYFLSLGMGEGKR